MTRYSKFGCGIFCIWHVGVAATALSVALLLTGCLVGPKYKQPAVPTAPTFKEADAFKDAPG